MGGYKRERKVYRLTFEDPDLAGFEITVRGLSSAGFLRLTKAAAAAQGIDPANMKDVAGAVVPVGDMFTMLAENTLEWNLEDDDGPVPVTVAAVLDQDFEFVMRIVDAWMTAVGGVAPPLPASSNGGGRFPEASIPMVPLSPSHSSS